jgi:hypothetical protein
MLFSESIAAYLSLRLRAGALHPATVGEQGPTAGTPGEGGVWPACALPIAMMDDGE